jgi:hypothetical protein
LKSFRQICEDPVSKAQFMNFATFTASLLGRVAKPVERKIDTHPPRLSCDEVDYDALIRAAMKQFPKVRARLAQ